MRERISMDKDWKFHFGDILSVRNRWAWGKSGSWNQGPESRNFDDSEWRDITLPHDFVIETKPYEYSVQEFNDGDNVIPLMEDVGNIHTTAGSFKKDVGWYRKHFDVPASDEGRKIYLVFDGIYRDSHVYLNEFFIGHHRSGYTGVKYDITDFVNYGGDNLLVVKCDAREAEGWFYEGGGIYRHAYLIKTEKAHIEDAFVDYDADIENKTANLKIKVEVDNPDNENLTLSADIYNASGEVVKTIAPTDANELTAELTDVTLWDTENPYLYSVKLTLSNGGRIIDEYTETFGIRTIEFTADKGFFLNGKNVKLKGVCCHQNHGGLGTALNDEIFAYRVKRIKEMGANAYRCAHYPHAKELLYECDKQGLLVMDETRLLSSAREDLEQLEYMVKTARNHPSVILYSIGNEEAQSQTTAQGGRIAGTMIKTVKTLDPTRPVTMALLMWNLRDKKPLDSVDDISAISKKLDVAGFNYHTDRWEEFHNKYPNQPMVSTEMGTFKSTRGCYDTDRENCHLNMLDEYDAFGELVGAFRWKLTNETDYISGLFLWTGFDYYGEPTPFAWPAISSQFGIMDICGYPKDFYYYYKSWWTDEPTVHICSHWNFKTGEKRKICVFGNCDEIELFVNGKSIGKKTMDKDGFLIRDGVEYADGEIKAVGYNGGKTAAEHVVKTAGEPHGINLVKEFSQNGTAIIRAEIVDNEGIVVPYADNEIEFAVERGKILGTSNGNPSDHTLAHSNTRRAFNGLAQVVVEYNSDAKIRAVSPNLIGTEIEI